MGRTLWTCCCSSLVPYRTRISPRCQEKTGMHRTRRATGYSTITILCKRFCRSGKSTTGKPPEPAGGRDVGSERFARRGGSPFRFDQDIHGIRAAIPKVQANAAIGQLRDGGRDRGSRQIPSGGEHDRVAGAAQAAIEDQFIPVEPV